jgi:hypothetical protein
MFNKMNCKDLRLLFIFQACFFVDLNASLKLLPAYIAEKLYVSLTHQKVRHFSQK